MEAASVYLEFKKKENKDYRVGGIGWSLPNTLEGPIKKINLPFIISARRIMPIYSGPFIKQDSNNTKYYFFDVNASSIRNWGKRSLYLSCSRSWQSSLYRLQQFELWNTFWAHSTQLPESPVFEKIFPSVLYLQWLTNVPPGNNISPGILWYPDIRKFDLILS